MTIAAAKKDEKVEKRRALGRGMESLLPGPRVVAPPSRESASGSSGNEVGDTQVSRLARVDNEVVASADKAGDVGVIPIQALQTPGNLVVNLDVGLIDRNPYQTRYVFEEELLQELAVSIKEHGVVQPVVVRPAEEDGRYILVLGERRLRASKLAGKDTIPALVRRLSLQQAAEMTVLGNVVRQDLNPLEQGGEVRGVRKDVNLTQVQIAERGGGSREEV